VDLELAAVARARVDVPDRERSAEDAQDLVLQALAGLIPTTAICFRSFST
jgi:hypothetical protein